MIVFRLNCSGMQESRDYYAMACRIVESGW